HTLCGRTSIHRPMTGPAARDRACRLQEMLAVQMTDALECKKGERTAAASATAQIPTTTHKNLKSTNILEPLNEETRGARMWCGSYPMRLHAAGRCGPWQWRRTRTGSRPTAISRAMTDFG